MINIRMKWSNFKFKTILLLAFSFVSTITYAQSGYENRIERYHSNWNKLIPRYTKIQYAGLMGLISVGTGWDYGKNRQWETDVYLGYVPKYSTDEKKITMTLRQNFIPWKKDINEHIMIEPLACGIYANTVFGSDFWVNEPDKYPNDYYSFSTKVRFNIYAGQRITYKLKPEKRFFAKSITLFYEIGSCDLYIASAFTNKYLKPTDYLRLSFGLKMQIL